MRFPWKQLLHILNSSKSNSRWTFKIKFKCKVDGDLCELEVRVDDDLKEHKISELGEVEVDSAMNGEVT